MTSRVSIKTALRHSRKICPGWAAEIRVDPLGRIAVLDQDGRLWGAEIIKRFSRDFPGMSETHHHNNRALIVLIPVFGPVPPRGVSPHGRDAVNRALAAEVCAIAHHPEAWRFDG